MNARLYGILDFGYVAPNDASATAAKMIHGGVQILQLRAKNHAPEFLLPIASELARICRDAGIPFVVNDHIELARDSGAHGVHVGQDDLSVADARRLLGRPGIVGKSTHSLAQAKDSLAEEPDYIGFGPLFATPTKPDYTPIGTEDIHAVHETVKTPIFCIGGIKLENLQSVLEKGARRVVIVSGILHAEDIPAYCRGCRALLDRSA